MIRTLLLAVVITFVGTAAAKAQVPYAVGYAPVYGVPTVAYRPVTPIARRQFVAMPVAPVAYPVQTYVAPAPIVVAPAVAPVVTTRYRPILGGSVSRVRYAPAATFVTVY